MNGDGNQTDTHVDAGPPPPDVALSMEAAVDPATPTPGGGDQEEAALAAAMASAVDAGPPPPDVLVGFAQLDGELEDEPVATDS